MRRHPTARVLAAMGALSIIAVTCTLTLSGCSASLQTEPDASAPASPAPEVTNTPLPKPTSTLRIGTASDPLRYAALGDSYSAGVGGGYEHGRCQRSPNAYPRIIAKSDSIELSRFAACSGATTEDVLADQIDALDPQIDLVTITIGGNDLNVSALPSACGNGQTADCKAAVTTSVALLNTLPRKLERTYKAIAEAAPHARILVADYPLFYDLPPITEKTIGSEEVSAAIAVDTAVASLDATIEQTVQKQREAGTDIQFVDVPFSGHGVNSEHPWFVLNGVDAYHPTKPGYKRYATVLESFLR